MRSTITLILGVIIIALVGVFVFQNNMSLTIKFIQWSYPLTAGTTILFAFLGGILLGIVWFVPKIIYNNFVIRSLRKKILQDEKENYDIKPSNLEEVK